MVNPNFLHLSTKSLILMFINKNKFTITKDFFLMRQIKQ